MSYVVNFFEPPPIGKVIFVRIHRRPVSLTLFKIEPYTRRDGTPSFVLHWHDHKGRVATSGLRGNSVTWAKVVASPAEWSSASDAAK